MDDDIVVWPDSVRGIWALLEGATLLGVDLKPEVEPKRLDFKDEQLVVVQLENIDTREGYDDRVQEVRLTVYGWSTFESVDIYEAILAYISGEDVTTPALHNWPSYYFDRISRNQGPSSPNYPDDKLFPATGTVLVRARPMA